MEHLNEQQQKQLRETLMSKKTELEQLLSDSVERAATVELDQTKVGRVSRGDALQQQQMAIANRSAYEKSLREIIAALAGMEKDDYGYCEACDEEIPFARLEIKPEARFCISCQEEVE